jgi:hypothetical protein
LFAGSFTNPGNLADPCNAGAVFQNATYTSSLGTVLYYIQLNAGITYSIVFSGAGSDQIGYYSVRIAPTIVVVPISSPTFNQPSRSSTSTCTPDTYYTTAAWDAISVVATENTYIIVQSYVSYFNYFDAYTFIYSGDNTGNSGTAPSACPVTGSLVYQGYNYNTPLVFYPNVGSTYTIVCSSDDGSAYNDGYFYAYTFYAFTGLPIGNNPVATTNGGATGGPTGGATGATGVVSTTQGSTTGGGLTSGQVSGSSGNTTTARAATIAASSSTTSGSSSTTSAAHTNSVAFLSIALFAFLAVFVAL